MKRIGALLLSAALLLSGCSTGGGDPYVPTGDGLYQGETPVTPQVQITKEELTIPYYPEKTLNPYICNEPNNKALLSLMYQGLFALDQDYETWPVLCQGYTVSWDLKTYTFTLVDALFSDGTPVRARDVVASLTAAMEGEVYKGRFSNVSSISETEDGAVEIALTMPCESLVKLLDVPIVKESQVADEVPMGTGPYAFVSGEQPYLQRCSGWWCNGGVPVTAEKIKLQNAGTPSELRDAFEFANLSMVITDPGSDAYADFHSDYELWESENGICLYLACNRESEVLSNVDLRRELLQAIDRESIIMEYYRGFATSTTLPASPHSPYYNSALANQYSYQPMRLIQAVEEYGEEVIQEISLLVNSEDGIRLRVANRIAQDLNRCGMKVKVNALPAQEYVAALEAGEFDMYLGQTRLSSNMDLSAFFAPEGTLSFGGMADPEIYTLCLEALANQGNYYNLYQKILETGMLCPILFRSYAIYTRRGSFRGLVPARDNLFFYHLGRTMEDALILEE